MPARAEGSPPEEEELIHAKPFGLAGGPACPGGYGIYHQNPRRAKAEDNAQENIAGAYPCYIGDGIDQIEMDGQQGERVQLLSLDGLIPGNLGIPIVGKKANVAWTVVADSRCELGWGEHETSIEEPSVCQTEA